MLFRSLSTGLLGACLLLLVSAHPPRLRSARMFRPPHVAAAPRAAGVTIVDVAAGVTASELPALLHLRSNEHVLAVDDHPVADDLAAGELIGEHAASADHRSFIDLTVGLTIGTVGTAHRGRRVLVLMH